MPRLSFRDRFLTPPVARALTSPGGILLAGAGAAVGIVAGLPIAAAAAVGAAAWVARVAVAVPRNPKDEHIDPFTIQDPWRSFAKDALQARARFDEAVSRARTGPLRDRLGEIRDRLAEGVSETWRVALAGQALADARRHIDVADISRQLDDVHAGAGGTSDPTSATGQTIEALEAQLATAARMDEVITETRNRLRLLDAKRDEAVTRAIELSVRTEASPELTGLRDDVDSLVDELEAVRQGMAETEPPAHP